MEVGVVTELFLIVVGLYLLECVRWVGRSSVGLRSFFPGLWRFVAPWQIASQWKRAIAVTAPWPPLGALHVIDGLPVNVGPRGVTVGGRHPDGWSLPGVSAVHVPWSELGRISFEEMELHVDGQPAVVLGTRRMTSALRRLFGELKDATPQRRARVLERFLARRMDLEEVRKRRARWRRWSWPLLGFCNLLLVVFFGAAYLLLFTGMFDQWRPILFGTLLVWSFTALVYDVAVLKVLPAGAQPGLGRRLTTLISPMSLMRAGDEVRAELYGDLDALAVGTVYVSKDQLQALGRRRLAELAYPLVPPEGLAGDDAQSDEAWLREKLMARTVKLLEAAGLDPEALVRPAAVPDAGTRSWCPRCQSQYTTEEGACANCPGVHLQPIASSPARDQAA